MESKDEMETLGFKNITEIWPREKLFLLDAWQKHVMSTADVLLANKLILGNFEVFYFCLTMLTRVFHFTFNLNHSAGE